MQMPRFTLADLKRHPLKVLGAALAVGAVTMLEQWANAGPKPQGTAQGNAGNSGYSQPRERANAGRDRAGDFDYYALVMSWSPTYCQDDGAGRDEPQCSRLRPYAFVLHGLWPQYESGFPSDCDIGRKPWVDQHVIDGMMDIMPSRNLIIHEYKKHGTCAGLDAEGYYRVARKLFTSIRIPEAYRATSREIVTSPGQIAADFLKANPQLTAASLAVDCAARGRRLREIRICFTRDGAPRACGRNENQQRLCSATTVVLPPVRG